MSLDLFATRTMLALLKQLYPPKTFLLDTFFKREEFSTTEYVDIDVIKGKRRMAPLVNSRSQAKVVERLGYSTLTFRPPYVKEKMESKAEDFLKRLAGDTIYQGDSSPAARAAKQQAEDLADLQEMCIRREEWMAAQALEFGKITLVGDGISDEIDFLMDATHFIDRKTTATQRWSHADSNPIKDLDTASKLIQKDSGLVPDIAVLGSDAADYFLDNVKVQAMLDNRRIELGQIVPDSLPNGAMYLGQLRKPRLDLYTYDEYYVADGTGTVTAMVNPKKVIVGSTRARTARHYGAIRDLRFAGLASVRWFPKTWEEEDPSVRWLMLQSAPLVAMHQPDAFVNIEVLA